MNPDDAPDSEETPEHPDRSALVIVYLTLFLDLLGFGIILPLLPYFAQRHGANGLWIGVLLAAYSVAVFFSAPIMGRLSDRIGRRPILLMALAGSTIAMILTGLADGLFLLIAARFLAGAFGGSISIAQAYVADVTRPEERAKYMGLVGASIGMGFIFGPALGALMAYLGYGLAGSAYVAAAVTGANFLFAIFKLPETHGKGGTRHPLAIGALTAALSRPGTGRILLANFLGTFAFVAMETTFALLGEARWGLNEARLGAVFAFVGVIGAVVQGGLIGTLTRRYGEKALAVAGALLLTLSLAALPHLPTFAIMMGGMAVLAIGQGLTTPSLASLLSKSASEDDQGGVLGVGQSLGALARATTPILAGLLYDLDPPAPYWMAAAGTALAAMILLPRLQVGVPPATQAQEA